MSNVQIEKRWVVEIFSKMQSRRTNSCSATEAFSKTILRKGLDWKNTELSNWVLDLDTGKYCMNLFWDDDREEKSNIANDISYMPVPSWSGISPVAPDSCGILEGTVNS